MWPENVGIKMIEVYFPAQYVAQEELEKYDGVSSGKYTVGLGQTKMGFCNDREDTISLCMSVVHRLLDKYNVKPQDIGRLEVGTETLIDKSKSIKSALMQLFEPFGCTDIEGVDSINACYGGTAALLNAISWIESSAWDGRLALVVAADNAIYSSGSARPTGGAGAIAMVVGPNAPLVFDRGLRASCMRHAYDFYKPDLSSLYPTVDGLLSIKCYLSALDTCYRIYCEKASKKCPGAATTLDTFDSVLFHSPYCKLVQKSFARLAFMDFLNTPDAKVSQKYPGMEQFHSVNPDDTYFNKEIEKAFVTASKADFARKTEPSLLIASQVGNMYTASVYSGLVSLLTSKPINELAGTKVGIFSYGSGFCSSMYSLTITKDIRENSELRKLTSALSYVKPQLEARKRISPEQFTKTLELREKNNNAVPYTPQSSITGMFPGSYYLVEVDEKYRRTYNRVQNEQ